MNMLLNFARNAIAAAATMNQPVEQMRMQLVKAYDRKGNHIGYNAEPVPNYRRLKSRGKGGKTAHSFSGVRAVKRAAAKRRNKKG
jgi:hypothetical protein